MSHISSFFKNPTSLLLAALVALSLLASYSYVKDTPGLDYYVAWVAADATENNNPNYIYNVESRFNLALLYRNKADEARDNPRHKRIAAHRKYLPMTATPFLYWVIAKTSTGNYERDLTHWHLLTIFLVTASILLMCRTLGYSATASLALLLPVLVWFVPLHSEFRVANVNGFQLGMVGLILWLQHRGSGNLPVFLSGLMIGLLVMFKPNLGAIAVLFAGAWLVRRQYDKLVYSVSGILAGAGGAVLVSSWWLSSATAWIDWLRVIERVAGSGPGSGSGNYAAVTQLSKNIAPMNQLWLALALCAVALAVFWWGQRSNRSQTDNSNAEQRCQTENMVLIATGCLITMLASTLVWLHYYLLLLPMFIVLMRPWKATENLPVVMIIVQRILPVLIFALLLDSALPEYSGVDINSYWNSVTTASTVALYVLGLWQLGYGIKGLRSTT